MHGVPWTCDDSTRLKHFSSRFLLTLEKRGNVFADGRGEVVVRMAARSCAPASGSSWPRRRTKKRRKNRLALRLFDVLIMSKVVIVKMFFCFDVVFCFVLIVLFAKSLLQIFHDFPRSHRDLVEAMHALGVSTTRLGSQFESWTKEQKKTTWPATCFQLPEVPCLWSFRRRHVLRLCRCVVVHCALCVVHFTRKLSIDLGQGLKWTDVNLLVYFCLYVYNFRIF